MEKLSASIKVSHKKILVYGESGTGKTTLAASFPGDLLIIDFDNKSDSAYNHWVSLKPNIIDGIWVEKISTNFSSAKPYEQFQALLTKLESEARSGAFKYKTVVLDSYTFYSKCLLGFSLSQTAFKRPTAGKPSFDDYAYIGKQFLSDIGRLFDLPCNFIGIGHIKKNVDDTTGAVTNTLLFDGNSAPGLAPKIFKEVYRSFVKIENNKPVHYLQTKSDGKFECNSPPGVPPVIPMSYEELTKYQLK